MGNKEAWLATNNKLLYVVLCVCLAVESPPPPSTPAPPRRRLRCGYTWADFLKTTQRINCKIILLNTVLLQVAASIATLLLACRKAAASWLSGMWCVPIEHWRTVHITLTVTLWNWSLSDCKTWRRRGGGRGGRRIGQQSPPCPSGFSILSALLLEASHIQEWTVILYSTFGRFEATSINTNTTTL